MFVYVCVRTCVCACMSACVYALCNCVCVRVFIYVRWRVRTQANMWTHLCDAVDDRRTMYVPVQPPGDPYISCLKYQCSFSWYSCTSSALTSWRALTAAQPASKSTTETTRQRRCCIPSVETVSLATLRAVATQYWCISCISSLTVLTCTEASQSTTQCSPQSKVW